MYSNTVRFTGLASGIDTQSLVMQLMKAESLKLNKLKQQRQTKEWQQAAYKEVATAMQNFQKAMLEYDKGKGIRNQNNFKSLTASASSDDISAKITDSKIAEDITFTVDKLGDKDSYVGNENKTHSMNTKLSVLAGGTFSMVPPNDKNGNPDPTSDVRGIYVDGEFVAVDHDINDTDEPTVQDLADALKTKGISLKYNKTISAFTMEGAAGSANDIMKRLELPGKGGTTTTDGAVKSIFNAIGLTDSANSTQQHFAGDAEVTYMGKTVPVKGNTFEIEGIEVTLSNKVQIAASGNATEYTVEAKTDVSDSMETIKNFVAEYNKLIDVISGQTDTKRPKSGSYTHYEPLTDDEKDAMSEEQIEKWEEKAKTGLLYRDNILSSISSQMRNTVYQEVDVGRTVNFKAGSTNKTTLAMFEIGITTSSEDGYIGKLEIDEEKLQKALESDMDAVMNMFRNASDASVKSNAEGRNARLADPKHGIGARLNDVLNNAVSGTDGLLSTKAGVTVFFETDNSLYNEMQALDDRIYQMNKILAEKENHYYSMFSAMENAISQSNSQMSALTAMS